MILIVDWQVPWELGTLAFLLCKLFHLHSSVVVISLLLFMVLLYYYSYYYYKSISNMPGLQASLLQGCYPNYLEIRRGTIIVYILFTHLLSVCLFLLHS